MIDGARGRRGHQTSNAIAAAAERLFASHGTERTTVDDVATVAGVSVGSVYVHYGSKDDLHATLVRRAVDDRAASVSRRFWSDSALERVVNTGDAYADFALHRPHGFWLAARASELATMGLDRAEAERFAETEAGRQLAADVDEAIAAGELRAETTAGVVDYLWGAWTGILALQLVEEPSVELRRRLHFAFRVAVAGLTREGDALPAL